MDETLDIKSCPIEFPNLLWRKDLRDSNGSHVKQTKRSDASDFFEIVVSSSWRSDDVTRP